MGDNNQHDEAVQFALFDETMISDISVTLSDITKELEIQRSESRNVIIGVLVASVLIVFTVAVDILYGNSIEINRYDAIHDKLSGYAVRIDHLELAKHKLPDSK